MHARKKYTTAPRLALKCALYHPSTHTLAPHQPSPPSHQAGVSVLLFYFGHINTACTIQAPGGKVSDAYDLKGSWIDRHADLKDMASGTYKDMDLHKPLRLTHEAVRRSAPVASHPRTTGTAPSDRAPMHSASAHRPLSAHRASAHRPLRAPLPPWPTGGGSAARAASRHAAAAE